MRIAIPNKGRLQQPTINLLQLAGVKPLSMDERALVVPTSWNNVELIMVRPEDIPYVVESGGADLGITGHDYVVESNTSVTELLRLDFGYAKIVLAVPQSWNVKSVDELPQDIRIATKYYNIAVNYLRSKKLRARLIRISGAAEVMPYLGAADAVIDVTSTGTTLKLHGLKILDVIMETYATLIAPKDWMRSPTAEELNLVVTMIKGVVAAKGKKLVFMNVPDDKLANILSVLPAMLAPAITKLSRHDVWEVITVVSDDVLPEVVAKVKAYGGKDLVIVDIEKVIE
ncbi:MAG: ATP phosphoribosyltransferase [Sulfolobales archaeon]